MEELVEGLEYNSLNIYELDYHVLTGVLCTFLSSWVNGYVSKCHYLFISLNEFLVAILITLINLS